MRPRKSAEERREEIVAAILDLALAHGPEGVSTEAIAGRLGVTQAAIFRHFPRKQDMWAAVVAWAGERMAEHWAAAQAGETQPAARLRSVLGSQWRFVAGVPALPAVMFSRALHGEEPLRLALRTVMGRFHAVLAGIVTEGQQAGDFCRDITADQVASLLIAMLQGTALRWLMVERAFDLVTEGEALAEVVLRGLRHT